MRKAIENFAGGFQRSRVQAYGVPRILVTPLDPITVVGSADKKSAQSQKEQQLVLTDNVPHLPWRNISTYAVASPTTVETSNSR